MRFLVEPSPAGGWLVKLAGHDAPVSRHDTEEEAHARAESYRRGASADGERATLRDGSVVLIRPIAPEDKPLFVAGWEHFGETSRLRRFMGVKQHLTLEDLAFMENVYSPPIGALNEPIALAAQNGLANMKG